MLETKRLLLRACTDEDAMDIYAFAKDRGVAFNAGWEPHTSVENTREIIKTILKAENNFVIVDQGTNKVIGEIGLGEDLVRKNIEGVKNLGYCLAREYWGKGIMQEAGEKILEYGFLTLNLAMISVNHYDFNYQSQRVIEKLGFKKDGCFRMCANVNKKLVDGVFYSLTKEEYLKRNQ